MLENIRARKIQEKKGPGGKTANHYEKWSNQAKGVYRGGGGSSQEGELVKLINA